jgi:phage/plasmid-associated DNA primase
MTPYEQVNQWLKNNLEHWLPACFPGGKRDGHNFVTGDINGTPGRSFSICLGPESKRGLYKDFATGQKASRDLVSLYKHARDIPPDDHARFFQDFSGFSGLPLGSSGGKDPTNIPRKINWLACVRKFTILDAINLAAHPKRRFLPETILWLHEQGELGIYNDKISFPMRSADGAVVGVHRWFEEEGKLKFINSPTLWILGDRSAPTEVHIHESVWDMIAMLDRTGWHLEPGKLFLCTRGISNAKLLRGQIPSGVKPYIWEQHDQPRDNGQPPANEGWRANATQFCGCQLQVVRIPPQCKDLNEWTIAGASAEDLVAARDAACLYQVQESESPQAEAKVHEAEVGKTYPQHPCTTITEDWLTQLERDYHGPTLPNRKGQPGALNERFWAALYAHEHQTVYEPDESRIYVYSESKGLFGLETTESLREQIASRMYQLAALRQSAIADYAAIPRFITMHHLNGVVEALKGLAEQKNFFKRTSKSPIYVHAANCMLVWNSSGFHQEAFSPQFHSRNQSPIVYEPEAGYADFYDAFLERLPDYDANAIQKYFGQCLLGRNLTQSILLLDGVADSSKTTLALVVCTMIGLENCAELRTSQLDERFESSAFIGKTLLMAPDVKADFLSLYGASIMKRLCGSDLMDAEFKRSNRRVQFEGVYNMIVTSNARLRARLQGDAGAWRRRLIIVRFQTPRTGERIADFHLEIINREGSGILNFALRGASALMADIKQYGGIRMSQQQIARVNKFIDESDSLRNFVRDNLSATSDSKHDLTMNEVLDRYYKHCLDNDLNSLGTKDARRELDELMRELFGKTRSNSIQREGKNAIGYPKMKWRDSDDER